MRPLRVLFAASILSAAALAAPRPAAAFDNDAVLRTLVVLILSTDSLDHERRHSVPVVIDSLSDGSSAYFERDSDRIVVNRVLLDAAVTQLQSCTQLPKGTSPEELMAFHLLPVVGHELHHKLLDSELGGTAANKEDEIASFIEEMLVYHEIRRRRPEIFASCATPYAAADYQLSERFWKPNGVDGLVQYVSDSKFYGRYCSVQKDEDIERCRKLAKVSGGKDREFWDSDERIEKAKERYLDQEFPRGRREWEEQKRDAASP